MPDVTSNRSRLAGKAWERVTSKRRDRGIYARRRERREQLGRAGTGDRAYGSRRFGMTDFAYWEGTADPAAPSGPAPDLRVQVVHADDSSQLRALVRRKTPSVAWLRPNTFVTMRCVRGTYADVGADVAFVVREMRCGESANLAECTLTRVG